MKQLKYLGLKLLRDIRQAAGQYIAITLVILLGVAFYCGTTSASGSVRRNIDEFYEAQTMADFWVVVPEASDDTLNALRTLPGVAAAESRAAFTIAMDENEFTVHSITNSVNVPFLESGELPREATECMLDRGYASVNNMQVGDLFANLQLRASATVRNCSISPRALPKRPPTKITERCG